MQRIALVFHIYSDDDNVTPIDDIIGELSDEVDRLTGYRVSWAEWNPEEE